MPRGAYVIAEGYRPGIVGRIVSMHADYYSREHGFGLAFESKVAAGLAAFIPRADKPGNHIWTATVDGDIAGSIAIDSEDLGTGEAHLRWFITDDRLRGSGAGRDLLTRAVHFCDEQRLPAIQLWTFAGLDAARYLYENLGFTLTEEFSGAQWGATVIEQRFTRRRPS